MRKPQLIILSDIHGLEGQSWIDYYTEALSPHFYLTVIDSLVLAELNADKCSPEEIHEKMVSEGIKIAAENLLKIKQNNCTILAFSVGGVIAWKAGLLNFQAHKLIAVSSTRLRKEHQKPNFEIDLFFGDQDMNRPMDEWFEAIELAPTILRNKNHDMYRMESVSEQICTELTSNIYF
ncbi:MAG: hypothetical protein ACSHXL_00620 [Bacteroidota bacterium]